MEVDLEGGQGSCNYNPEALDASKLRALKLEGLRVDMRADFALATIKCAPHCSLWYMFQAVCMQL